MNRSKGQMELCAWRFPSGCKFSFRIRESQRAEPSVGLHVMKSLQERRKIQVQYPRLLILQLSSCIHFFQEGSIGQRDIISSHPSWRCRVLLCAPPKIFRTIRSNAVAMRNELRQRKDHRPLILWDHRYANRFCLTNYTLAKTLQAQAR